MGKSCEESSTFIFNMIFFILAYNEDKHESLDEFEFRQIIVFRKFATELWPLIDVRIWFLLNILRTNRQIETKFCIHTIIDKINISIVNLCFFANLQQSYGP